MDLPPIDRRRRWRSGAAVVLALALPTQAAQAAAATCLRGDDVRAMAAYALPSAVNGLVERCSPHLPADGFLRSRGPGLAASYAGGKQAAWPRARQALLGMAGTKGGGDMDAMAGLPDEALQPFVEGMIGSMIANEIKPGQCGTAERLLRVLAPLPSANLAELIGLLAELGARNSKKSPGGLALCPQ